MDSAGFGKCQFGLAGHFFHHRGLQVAKTPGLGLPAMAKAIAADSQKVKPKDSRVCIHVSNEGLLRKGRLLGLITRPEYIVEWEKL